MRFIIQLLAVARITYLFVDEDGPLGIFVRMRDYFGLTETTKMYSDNILKNTVTDLLDCKWCFSVWAASIVLILDKVKLKWLNTILATSMVSIIIFSIMEVKEWLVQDVAVEK
jgi:hypothetical protein